MLSLPTALHHHDPVVAATCVFESAKVLHVFFAAKDEPEAFFGNAAEVSPRRATAACAHPRMAHGRDHAKSLQLAALIRYCFEIIFRAYLTVPLVEYMCRRTRRRNVS